MTMNGSSATDDYSSMRTEFDSVQQELRTLRETYTTHKDNWIKEKLDMQVR